MCQAYSYFMDTSQQSWEMASIISVLPAWKLRFRMVERKEGRKKERKKACLRRTGSEYRGSETRALGPQIPHSCPIASPTQPKSSAGTQNLGTEDLGSNPGSPVDLSCDAEHITPSWASSVSSRACFMQIQGGSKPGQK